jgi:hypothetical protein
MAGIKGELTGREGLRGGHGHDWRKEGDDPNRWVPHVSGEREREVYQFRIRLAGPQAETRAGPDWLPGAFSPLFLSQSIFYFPEYFITN